jgi:hypothetical protein
MDLVTEKYSHSLLGLVQNRNIGESVLYLGRKKRLEFASFYGKPVAWILRENGSSQIITDYPVRRATVEDARHEAFLEEFFFLLVQFC